MKKIILLVLSLFAMVGFANAQVFGRKIDPEADSAWKAKPIRKYPQTSYPFTNEDHIAMLTEAEYYGKDLRDWGIDFWQKFPNDPRAAKALFEAFSKKVFYWQDPKSAFEQREVGSGNSEIPIDTLALNKWNQTFPILKQAYLNSIYVTEEDRLIFKKSELVRILLGPKFWDQWYERKLPVNIVLKAFEDAVIATKKLDSTNIYNKIGGTNIFTAVEAIFIRGASYGWDLDNDMNSFLQLCINSKVEEVRDWGLQKAALLSLKKIPFKFRHKDVDGKLIDLVNYKGKVVLLDFWATWCKGCISGMNGVKDVYEKLHSKGFEVISVSIDLETNKENVLKIKDKIGFTWPLMIIGGKNYKDGLFATIQSKYGFTSVPQLLLFDKSGNLVEYKGPLLNREGLQRTVEEYLK